MKRLKIADVASVIATLRQQAKPCVLLLGAGCSRSAPIPVAGEVVEYVRFVHRSAYDAASRGKRKKPNYPDVMKSLDPKSRRLIFREFCTCSSLNLAHAALGALVREGYIGRILTTNFDDLAERGCALQGVYPPVYDLGILGQVRDTGERTKLLADFLRSVEPMILHLHGRHHGPYQVHTSFEGSEQSERLAPVVRDAHDRVWIVAGYSGDSDPLWNTIRTVLLGRRPAKMFWVNLEPPSGRRERDLANAGGCYVNSAADAFFERLATELLSHGSVRRAPTRWKSYPIERARFDMKQLADRGSGDERAREAEQRRMVRKARAVLMSRPDRAWKLSLRVLGQLDPDVIHRRLRLLVTKRKRIPASNIERSDEYRRIIEQVRVLRATDDVRCEAIGVAARATIRFVNRRHRLPMDWKQLGTWFDGRKISMDLPGVRLANATLLLARCLESAARGRGPRPGLLKSSLERLRLGIRDLAPAQLRQNVRSLRSKALRNSTDPLPLALKAIETAWKGRFCRNTDAYS